MPQREPIKTIATSELDPDTRQVVRQVGQNKLRVTLEDDGQQVAAIISADDFERLQRYDDDVQAGFNILNRMRTPFKDIPSEQIERDVREIVEEVRREQREDSAASSA